MRFPNYLPREGLPERQSARMQFTPILQPGRDSHGSLSAGVVSRRRFLQATAGASGLFLGAGLGGPFAAAAPAGSADPRPIPGGIQPFGPRTEVFHLFLPEPGNEASTITDFNGFLGVARITGYGTATDGAGHSRRLFYDADIDRKSVV